MALRTGCGLTATPMKRRLAKRSERLASAPVHAICMTSSICTGTVTRGPRQCCCLTFCQRNAPTRASRCQRSKALESIAATWSRCGTTCSGINCPFCHQLPISGPRCPRSSSGSWAAKRCRSPLQSALAQPRSRSGPVSCRAAFQQERGGHWRSFASRQQITSASILTTTAARDASSLTHCGKPARETSSCTRRAQILVRRALTESIKFRVPPSRIKPSRRAISSN